MKELILLNQAIAEICQDVINIRTTLEESADNGAQAISLKVITAAVNELEKKTDKAYELIIQAHFNTIKARKEAENFVLTPELIEKLATDERQKKAAMSDNATDNSDKEGGDNA